LTTEVDLFTQICNHPKGLKKSLYNVRPFSGCVAGRISTSQSSAEETLMCGKLLP